MRGAVIALGLSAAWCVGCTTLRVEIDQPISWRPDAYCTGVTHYRAVLADLGPPAKVSASGEGVALLYEHLLIREHQLGLSLDEENLGQQYEFLQWIKFAYAQAWADRESLLLVFDRDGVLQTQSFRSWRDDLGTGSSVQMIVELASVVDSTPLREDFDVNHWGRALLRRPPETLNARQSLDLGVAGLELRGAPDHVGQHTLEMRKETPD